MPVKKQTTEMKISPSPGEDTRVSFEVAASETGERLDRVVTARFPELSRTRVQELIDGELVQVDGLASKGAHRMHGGDTSD